MASTWSRPETGCRRPVRRPPAAPPPTWAWADGVQTSTIAVTHTQVNSRASYRVRGWLSSPGCLLFPPLRKGGKGGFVSPFPEGGARGISGNLPQPPFANGGRKRLFRDVLSLIANLRSAQRSVGSSNRHPGNPPHTPAP